MTALGVSATMRTLIVNADDLGLSTAVNDGIFAAHAGGIVTSTSLMVRWPAAAEAVARVRAFPQLGLGLHLDFGEWAFRDGEWVALYEVVTRDDPGAVAAEVARQLDAFRRLVGREPTHLDSHQHAHREEPLRSVVVSLARELGVPLRHETTAIRYCGDFYGQSGEGEPYPEGVSVENLLAILAELPAGITELCCHPGVGAGLAGLDTMYRCERAAEVRALCDPRVRQAIRDHSIRLCSFSELRGDLA